jgi:lysophospholipase L1-like esterase
MNWAYCMARSCVATLALLAVDAQSAQPAQAIDAQSIRIILVGDSTIAPQTGYGDALCRRFQANVTCLNLAKGGRSSASYRAEGSWEQVTKLLADGGQYRATYVLIQFGHNDQPGKPGRSTDLVTGFTPNMARYAREVTALHAIPVLVTPLSRRSFKQNILQNDLQPWAEAVRKVAVAEQVPLLDLNADSSAALQVMGTGEADTLAMAPPTAEESQDADGASQKPKGSNYRGFDRTHLGAKGAAYFARMVEQELIVAIPAVAYELAPEN